MSKRLNIRVTGIVQGVGFRPFVYNLAERLDLSGFVGNDSDGVFIEAQGSAEKVAEFLETLETSPPPLSQVDTVTAEEIAPVSPNGFAIKKSVKGASMATLISPDMAICGDCAKELKDPMDRRYHYPFINCTNCGPRYSIIYDIPYDRPKTSMQEFDMCPECLSEYEDPGNRRFHAQPNACDQCGPWVTMYNASGTKLQDKGYAIVFANQSLRRGSIVAIKGLGGFHLACDAHNKTAIAELRKRKHREKKPLAVMVKDLEVAHRYANLTPREIEILTSRQAPIVLAEKNGEISKNIAPGNPRIGLMLPYTPLHHLLFASANDALVMTSGNYTDEPICIDNQDALDRLSGIADFTLVHKRDILQRVDDSVLMIMDEKPRFLRRSRGYVPRPIPVFHKTKTVLAVGAELKNTLCYTKKDKAFVSQHIGDLSNVMAMDFFHHTRKHLSTILEVEPEVLAYDLHPGYLATKWALSDADATDLPRIGVQHHHAHMASVMTEHQLEKPVIGIIMDGTGYGTDGAIWGGEILVGDYTDVRRFAHFEYVPEPGGDRAIEEPWRMGLAYLYHTFGEAYHKYLPGDWNGFPISQVIQMMEKKINAPLTSSCGRLFDGISALAGGRTHVSFEAQAAIEFQHVMTQTDLPSLEYAVEKRGEHYEILIPPIVQSVITSLENGAGLGKISYLFHEMLATLYVDLAERVIRETGIGTVVLSGGVFQNDYLFERLVSELRKREISVVTPEATPANDGGISLGQAAVAQALLTKSMEAVNYQYE